MVRPYTVTRGRTRSTDGLPELDVIALVFLADQESADGDGTGDPAGVPGAARPGGRRSGETGPLREEHLTLLVQCQGGPISVAELAAGADLPLGVVRVLIGDLIDLGCVRVTSPVPPAELPDVGLLHQLISGLKSL